MFSATNGSSIADTKPAKMPNLAFSGSSSSSKSTPTVTSSSSSSTSTMPLKPPYRNRFPNDSNQKIKQESHVVRPFKAMVNRFDSNPSAVESADAQGSFMDEKDIEVCMRLQKNRLGIEQSEDAKKIEALNETMRLIDEKEKEMQERQKQLLVNDILKALEDDNDTMLNDNDADNEKSTTTAHNSRNSSSSSMETPRTDSNRRLDVGRNERQFNAVRPIQSRFDNVPNVYDSPNAERSENRPIYPNNRQQTAAGIDNRNEMHTEHRYDDFSPQSPEQISTNNTASTPAPIRLAYSDKFVRRPRNSSGPSTPDLGSPTNTDPWTKTPVTAPAPPQDPRLRNRPPPSNQSTEPFPPYRNQQPLHVPLSQMPNATNVHGFMQPNINAYHPAPPANLQQFTHANETSFHAQSGRPQLHHPSNTFNAASYSANGPIHANNLFRSPPHSVPYSNPNIHMDPGHHQQSQHYQPPQQQQQQTKETYRDHKRRIEEEKRKLDEEKRRKAQAAIVAAAQVSSSTTVTDDKADDQQSNKESGSNKAKEQQQIVSDGTAQTPLDKAYGGNNWAALSLNKSSGSGFKIPKKNKPNTQNNGKTQTVPSFAKESDRSSPVEMNVSTTSNGKDSQSNKTSNVQATKKTSNDSSSTVSAKHKDTTSKKSTDKKKKISDRNSLDDTNQDDRMIVADTTIDVDSEQIDEQTAKSNQKSQSTQQQQQQLPEVAKPEKLNEIFEVLKDAIPENKYKQILSLLKDNANDNDVTSSTVPPVPSASESETVKKPTTAAKAAQKVTPAATAPTKPKKSTKHANELDRLTADIRENIPVKYFLPNFDFIARFLIYKFIFLQGVLSAIGPRACTLNAAAKMMDTSPRKTVAAKRTTSRIASSGHKSDDETHSDIGKKDWQTKKFE